MVEGSTPQVEVTYCLDTEGLQTTLGYMADARYLGLKARSQMYGLQQFFCTDTALPIDYHVPADWLASQPLTLYVRAYHVVMHTEDGKVRSFQSLNSFAFRCYTACVRMDKDVSEYSLVLRGRVDTLGIASDRWTVKIDIKPK